MRMTPLKKWFVFALSLISIRFVVFAELSVEDFLFTVECENGVAGSAFLFKDEQGVWMVTACQTLQKGQQIKFVGAVNQNSVFDLPESFEVARDRSVVRFPVDCSDGFSVVPAESRKDKLSVWGEVNDFVSKTKGTILTTNNTELVLLSPYTDPRFGNPVVNDRNEVIGVLVHRTGREGIEKKVNDAYVGAMSKDVLKAFSNGGSTYGIVDSTDVKVPESKSSCVLLESVPWQSVSRGLFFDESASAASKCRILRSGLESLVLMVNILPVENTDDSFFSSSLLGRYNRKVAKGLEGTVIFRYAPRMNIVCNKHFFQRVTKEADERMREFEQELSQEFSIEYFSVALKRNLDEVKDEIDRVKRVLNGADY